jgi:UDP-N-acetylmuramoylalanine-D-glutamate ligase
LIARIEKSQIKNLVFFPVSGEKISGMLGEKMYSTLHTSSMEEAVKFAYEHTSSGKICLLSTASPSYSVRKNFEENGDLFQEYIRQFSSVGRASHS